MPKYRPAASDLAKSLHPHVFNAINQLVNILPLRPPDLTWHNARIECIAIHARCLTDFFGTKAHDDDILASHFGFNENYSNEVLRTRAHKDICHLTFARIKNYPGNSQWRDSDLNRLLAICERFVAHILKSPILAKLEDEQAVVAWHNLRDRLSSYNAGRK